MATVKKNERGRFGAVITEAAISAERNAIFRSRVDAGNWDSIDTELPAEVPIPGWADGLGKLSRDLLWEIVGDATPISDPKLKDALKRELRNREIVFKLLNDAVEKTRAGTGPTAFMTKPLDESIATGCQAKPPNQSFTLFDLMIILHMFGQNFKPNDPSQGFTRPIDNITNADCFYSTQEEVAGEIQRRVRELVAGITWECEVEGGKEKKKLVPVWNRKGHYCGCG